MKINKKIIEELTRYLKEFNLSEIMYSEGTTQVKVSRSVNNATSMSVPSVNVPEKKLSNLDSNEKLISSPIVGTAYLAPEPGAKKFVKIGDKIKKGQTIMIVEAMKTMNHIPSTTDGEVSKILVEDGQPVEFGQTLVILK